MRELTDPDVPTEKEFREELMLFLQEVASSLKDSAAENIVQWQLGRALPAVARGRPSG